MVYPIMYTYANLCSHAWMEMSAIRQIILTLTR